MKLRFLYPVKDNTYRIIDGDTVSCILDKGFGDTKKVSIRLIGLNAPESRTRRALEKEAGLLVKRVVVQWFDGHKDKQLYATSEAKPKYAGRAVGKIWADSEEEHCLNTYLLEKGLVKAYLGGKRGFTDEELATIVSKCLDVLPAPK